MKFSRPRSTELLLGIAVLAIVALAYWPGLSGDFIFDDYSAIHDNPALQIDSLEVDGLKRAATSFLGSPLGRPVATMTLALDYYFWELDPLGYKLTNLVFHLLNTLLVFVLTRQLMQVGIERSDHWNSLAPVAVALIWAIHPLQVSTVLYVVQRMEIMAVTFTLIGLIAYLHGRMLQINRQSGGWWWIGLTVPAGVIAVFSKENGALLPLFALCVEFTLLHFRAREPLTRRILQWGYGIGLAATVIWFAGFVWPQNTAPEAYDARVFTWDERLLTQLRILPMYLSQIVWPAPERLLFYYDSIETSSGWLRPAATLFGGMFLGVLLATGVLIRKSAPWAALGILWFFSAHLLTSNVFPLELAFEHRNYFALLGVLIGLADLLRRARFRRTALPYGPATLSIIAGLLVLTLIHSATWGNPVNLAMDLKEKNPESERAVFQLGQQFWEMSDRNPDSFLFTSAISEFEQAAALPDASPMPEQALIAMSALTDQPAEMRWWDSLIEKVEKGPDNSRHISAVTTLLGLYQKGHPVDAEKLMEAGLALINNTRITPHVHAEFAFVALEALDEQDLAMRILEAASAIMGNDPDWNDQLIRAVGARGHEEFARELEGRLQ